MVVEWCLWPVFDFDINLWYESVIYVSECVRLFVHVEGVSAICVCSGYYRICDN